MVDPYRRVPPVLIHYTNHRGETAWRRILPGRVWFGWTEWHPRPAQWFLRAWDAEKEAERDFALRDVREWREVSAAEPTRPTPAEVRAVAGRYRDALPSVEEHLAPSRAEADGPRLRAALAALVGCLELRSDGAGVKRVSTMKALLAAWREAWAVLGEGETE